MNGWILALLMLATLPPVSAHLGHENGDIALVYESRIPAAYFPSTMQLLFVNATTGSPIPLDIAHERTLHAFIISDDRQAFAHIHPEDFPNGLTDARQGTYRITHLFPGGGTYHLILDYTTRGMSEYQMFNITVEGAPRPAPPPADLSRTRSSGSYAVELQAPSRIEAGKESELAFRISKDGAPVRDLEMYLGSEMHVFLASDQFTDIGHTHAYRPGHSVHIGAMPQRYSGPAVPVRYTFRQPGTYVLYVQFKEGGIVTTTQFFVRVHEPRSRASIALFSAGALAALIAAILGLRYFLRRNP